MDFKLCKTEFNTTVIKNILSIESKLKSLQHKSFSTSEGETMSLSALNSKGQLDNVYTRRLVRKLKMKRVSLFNCIMNNLYLFPGSKKLRTKHF